VCSEKTPELRDTGDGHQAACHFAEQLTLTGAVIGTAPGVRPASSVPEAETPAPQEKNA
jgi:hypothetical protein